MLSVDVPSVPLIPQNPASQGGEGSQRENLLPVPRHACSFSHREKSHTYHTTLPGSIRACRRAPLSCARRHVLVRPLAHLIVLYVPLKYSFIIRHRRRTSDRQHSANNFRRLSSLVFPRLWMTHTVVGTSRSARPGCPSNRSNSHAPLARRNRY